MNRLICLRRSLHAHPSLSGDESETAARVRRWLEESEPDEIVDGLGGCGLAAVFRGVEAGPTVLLRAELDALPIAERRDAEHRSQNDGISHACGHDGHMAMLAALAPALAARRPRRGRVVLLFQPAEETGAGARRVVEDAAFARLRPDLAFALHNLPGEPLGRVLVRPGTFAVGSVGMRVRLQGRTSHAAHPEQGLSPGPTVAELIGALGRLGATVTHARLGDASFGIAPGEAVLLATLRSASDGGLERLREHASRRAGEAAAALGLAIEIDWHEPFPATVNDPGCVDTVVEQARAQGLDAVTMHEPVRWSEDFGWFLQDARGAMFGLGAGVRQPPLHAPDYDFPDELLEIGARLWRSLVDRVLGVADAA